ncbi:DUF2971 domain-containing protein [Bradyrhizobium sp. Arg237L]|uniref:DUF2971 domain-containing protein n=1 Tax=Bradyrhizobium sp. Arg237L TaxID=3003352 RepID=UPI00249F4731|nr:DUF2971 domain-containing protein [Bradyrhizobium sp. Arg237L]MDI4237759.1 DUF2971 domain-containing protein [Bradyrhizobium sp. Arg237L]
MAGGDKIPKRFYKYRAFSNLTLDMLVADHLFFADPSTFNDPLDTRACLETDVGEEDLERVFVKFVERRVTAEMTAAAKKIKYRGPKTVEHISRQARRRAKELIAEIRYNAENPEYEIENPFVFLLGQYVEEELLRQYDKGIVSFAERANCPLMWSHYGDQHKGVCIGYSVPVDAAENFYKVKYGGSRLVQVSKVVAMLDGDDMARQAVDAAVLLRKAASWRYEREWRLIGQRGLRDSPLELEEVIFGMRCESAVKYAVVRALEDRCRPIRFYEMRDLRGTFHLKKCVLDTDELCAFFPRRWRSIFEEFDTNEVDT